jgi:hypothetical protein
MKNSGYVFQSELARTHIAQGVEQGRIDTLRELVLAVLRRRELPVTDAQRAVVAACTDAARLHVWLINAVTATSAGDVLASDAVSAAS